ncbi:hypothetical protein [Herpetosiphon giganteus]|uniref:hypothetical protein n=1 Tax=Herpetosiphon giganteus TaxID=2029754 RepID=UPI001957E311|nr:hypothetical protein [Herpetosiphon giganteus]MBM7843797.1 hypothetical protein [Herpetosiphon giganteus]
MFDEAGAYGEFEEIEVETNGVWVPRFGLLVNANIGIGGHYPLLHCAGFDSSTHAEAVRTAVAYSDAVIHHLTKHEAMVKAINTYMDAKKAFYAHGGTKGKFETAFLDSQAPIDHAWATFTFIPEAYE